MADSASILDDVPEIAPSDSEAYDASGDDTTTPSQASSGNTPPLILYSPPTLWGLLRGAAINLLLPFVNGLMLGFGELFAHEAAFRLGWSGTKVSQMLSITLLFRMSQTWSSLFRAVLPIQLSRL